MAEPIINSQSSAPTEPELRQNPHEPMGVLRKNLKPLLYLGVAGLVIAAAVFSSTGKKTPAQQAAASHEPPQPMVQDNTDNNVQDLKNQLATEKQQSTQAGLTPAQASAMSSYSPTGQQTPCVPGQTCPQQQNGYGQAAGEPQLSPAQQEAQQLAIKERQLTYDSRFASNLVYAHQSDAASQQQVTPAAVSGQFGRQPRRFTRGGRSVVCHCRADFRQTQRGGKYRFRRWPAVCDLRGDNAGYRADEPARRRRRRPGKGARIQSCLLARSSTRSHSRRDCPCLAKPKRLAPLVSASSAAWLSPSTA